MDSLFERKKCVIKQIDVYEAQSAYEPHYKVSVVDIFRHVLQKASTANPQWNSFEESDVMVSAEHNDHVWEGNELLKHIKWMANRAVIETKQLITCNLLIESPLMYSEISRHLKIIIILRSRVYLNLFLY